MAPHSQRPDNLSGNINDPECVHILGPAIFSLHLPNKSFRMTYHVTINLKIIRFSAHTNPLEPTYGAFLNHSPQEPQSRDLDSETLGWGLSTCIFKYATRTGVSMHCGIINCQRTARALASNPLCHFLVCDSTKLLNLLCFYFLICKMKIIPPLPHTVSE